MGDALLKLVPWLISGILVVGVAWGVLKTTVSGLAKSLEEDKKLNTNNYSELKEGIEDIGKILQNTSLESRQMREADQLKQDRRNTEFEKRMNNTDERNNLIAASNQKLTQTVETLSDRMEDLTSAVLSDISKNKIKG